MRIIGCGFLSLEVWVSDIDPLVCLSESEAAGMGWPWSYLLFLRWLADKRQRKSVFRGFVRMMEQVRAHQVALRALL